MDIRNTVLNCLRETVEEQTQSTITSEITDDSELVNFRLDSLGFADLLTRLQDALGYDPFTQMDDPVYPRTFGELVAIYEDFKHNAKVQ